METLRVVTDAVLRVSIVGRAGVDTVKEDDTRVLSNRDTSAVMEDCGVRGIIALDWLVNITPTTEAISQRIAYFACSRNGRFSDFTLCFDAFFSSQCMCT